MELTGKVKHIELYGAFVDVGVGTDALLHISQLGKANVRNVEDVVKVDEAVTVYVLKVDKDAGRIALSLVKPPAVSWDTLKEGDTIEGEVVRVESFGAFIEFGAERPGMVHVSEMKDGYVKSPDEVVKVGDRIQARILKINRKKRQIDLTLKEQRQESYEIVSDEPEEELPTAMALALRKAMAQQDDRPSAAAREAAAKEKKRSEQEDIIARTLRQHS
jgi:ribosomal protein S1